MSKGLAAFKDKFNFENIFYENYSSLGNNGINWRRKERVVQHGQSLGKLHPLQKLANKKGKTFEEQQEAIIKNLKKIQRRIDKTKKQLNVPLYMETEIHKEARARLDKLESLANKQVFILHYIQAQNNAQSKRAVNLHYNRQAVQNRTHVRMEKGKYIPVNPKITEGKPVQPGNFNPLVKDHKKSTSKTMYFVDHKPNKPAWDKAEKEWQAIVKEKGPDYNLSD